MYGSLDLCEHLGSSVGTAIGYGLGELDSIPSTARLFSKAFRPALGPTQPPIQWIPGVKRQEHEDDHSPSSSAEVKNGGATLPLSHMSS
jgi:hypothetical protein